MKIVTENRLVCMSSILVAAMLSLGCGKKEEAQANEASQKAGGDQAAKEAVEEKTILFSVATTTINFAREMAAGGEYCGELVAGIDVNVAGPPAIDPPAQVKQLGDLAKTSQYGVAVENLAPALFERPMAQLVKEDRLVVAVDTMPTPGSLVETFIGNDNFKAGKELAQAAIERLPKDATGVVVLGTPGPGIPVLDARAEGMKAAFTEVLPNVKVLGPFETKQETSQNYAQWNSLMKTHPDALAFLGTGDADTYNMAKAKKQNGGKYLTGGFDLDPMSLAAVKDGSNFATMSPEHFFKGCLALNLLARATVGTMEMPKGWIDSGHLLVTSENVDAIIERQKTDDSKGKILAAKLDTFIGEMGTHTQAMPGGR